MEILENVDTGISVICGLGSILMFLLSKKQKNECIRISTMIDEKIEILNKNASINSKDQFIIDKVKTFDNRKSIK